MGRRTPDHPAAHRFAPTRRATSTTPEAVPPPKATPDRLQYESRWPRILLAKGSRPSSQLSVDQTPRHAPTFSGRSSYRKWSTRVVGISALGGIAYLADFAIGANIGIAYGTTNALWGHCHLQRRHLRHRAAAGLL